MATPPTVVLGHDDGLVRDIVTAACRHGGVGVLGEATSAEELESMCARLRPDVVLTADQLGATSVIEHVGRLAAHGPKVVVLISDGDVERLNGLLPEDVWGCLSPEASPQELVAAILAVARGGMALDGVTASRVVRQWRRLRTQTMGPHRRPPELTPREREVLVAMAEGLAAKAIAARLGVALKTVENHKIRVFDKLGVRSQAHAVTVALAYGLTEAPAGTGVSDAED